MLAGDVSGVPHSALETDDSARLVEWCPPASSCKQHEREESTDNSNGYGQVTLHASISLISSRLSNFSRHVAFRPHLPRLHRPGIMVPPFVNMDESYNTVSAQNHLQMSPT